MIVLVHGLGGDPLETWGRFPALIAADDELARYETKAFAYPTSLLRLPFSSAPPKVQTLADALRTFIDVRCADADEVVLVCHSLGGVIARQYLVDEARRNARLRARGLLLYGCPTTGAGLAEVASFISWRHAQLRQLCRDSDVLRSIEKDWETLDLPRRLSVRYVVAAQDRVVAEIAARSSWGETNVDVIADRGHIDVVKPTGPDDLPYLILRNFLRSLEGDATRATREPQAPTPRPSEPPDAGMRLPSSIGQRIDLQRFRPEALLGETEHSRIQRGTYKGETIVLKRTHESLCDLDALHAVVAALSDGLLLPEWVRPLLLGPRAVWAQDGFVWEVQDPVDGVPLGMLVDRNGKPLFGRFLEHCARQLVTMLEGLGRMGIVHRDITPDNLLLTRDGELRLIDWTFCVRPGGAREVAVATVGFTAPEQERGQAVHASDWFSAGATLYFLAHGVPPELRPRPGSAPLPEPADDSWTAGALAVAAQVLHAAPEERLIPPAVYWRRSSKPVRRDETLDSMRVCALGADAHLVLATDTFWMLPRDVDAFRDELDATTQWEERGPGLRPSLHGRLVELRALLASYDRG